MGEDAPRAAPARCAAGRDGFRLSLMEMELTSATDEPLPSGACVLAPWPVLQSSCLLLLAPPFPLSALAQLSPSPPRLFRPIFFPEPPFAFSGRLPTFRAPQPALSPWRQAMDRQAPQPSLWSYPKRLGLYPWLCPKPPRAAPCRFPWPILRF